MAQQPLPFPETRTSTKRPYAAVNVDEDATLAPKRTEAVGHQPPPHPPISLGRAAECGVGTIPRFLHTHYNDGTSRLSGLSADVVARVLAPLFTTCGGTRRLPGACRTDLTDDDMRRPEMCETSECHGIYMFRGAIYVDSTDKVIIVADNSGARVKNAAWTPPLLFTDQIQVEFVHEAAAPNRLFPDDIVHWNGHYGFIDPQTTQFYILVPASSLYAPLHIPTALSSADLEECDSPYYWSEQVHGAEQYYIDDTRPIFDVVSAARDGRGSLAIACRYEHKVTVRVFFATRPPLFVFRIELRLLCHLAMTFDGNGDLIVSTRELAASVGQLSTSKFHLLKVGSCRDATES